MSRSVFATLLCLIGTAAVASGQSPLPSASQMVDPTVIAAADAALAAADQVSTVATAAVPTLRSALPLLPDDQPPGTIGAIQLQRDCRLRGYYQPVQFSLPDGVEVSFAVAGGFADPMPSGTVVALLVGVPYRVKLTSIPFQPGVELFPTVELIDRTYPPPEKAHRFPIPVAIDLADIEAAQGGELVSRVVYLEDSQHAQPVSYLGPQRVYDAAANENMLATADYFGRPVAIVTVGSRVPATVDGTAADHFLFGSPPVAPVKPVLDAQSLREGNIPSSYSTAPGLFDAQ